MSDQTETDGRIFDNGDLIENAGHVFEVASVSHSDDEDGNHVRFSYNIRLKSDIDDERKAEAEHQEQLAKQEKETEE